MGLFMHWFLQQILLEHLKWRLRNTSVNKTKLSTEGLRGGGVPEASGGGTDQPKEMLLESLSEAWLKNGRDLAAWRSLAAEKSAAPMGVFGVTF